MANNGNVIHILEAEGYYVGVIDGGKCNNLKNSIINIAEAFRFPDYYGENLDAFSECINDLDWLNELNYALIISNSILFMSDDTNDNKLYLMILLNEVSNEWSSVPNYEGEESFRHKGDFLVIYK